MVNSFFPELIHKYSINKNKISSNIKLSIRSKILISFVIIILVMISLNLMLLLSSLKYNKQYKTIVNNITTINRINGILKTRIDLEMWNIVAGKTEFKDGNQYEIINDAKQSIREIMDNVRLEENRIRLDVTLRTIDTLTNYVDIMGKQIENKSKVAENEKILDEIRSVSSLIEDNIQEFILNEITSSEKVSEDLERNTSRWLLTNLIVIGVTLLFSMLMAWIISGSITKPIRELHKTTALIAKGNFDVRVEQNSVDEIAGLSRSFNTMIVKIKELIERNKKEQENLKKSELKVMQAQINPHFLYNTLDTIVWMAEANNMKQVIEIVRALSNFFRITLSRGKDWISVQDEVEHAKSYLIIQKIRYRDILNFSFDIGEEMFSHAILKLTLQPIIENALYHGIKNKRSGGILQVKGYKDEDRLIFEVMDDGMGMTKERLSEIQTELNVDSIEPVQKESGFGLNNVHSRIKLYYGKQYGISIESKYKEGTKVTICIPA